MTVPVPPVTATAGQEEPETDQEEDEDVPEQRRPFEPVVVPRVVVEWPAALIAPVSDAGPGELHRILADLEALATLLDRLVGSGEPGVLTPGGVRWDAVQGWQFLVSPPYEVDGDRWDGSLAFDDQARSAAWTRDLYAIATALAQTAFGRRPGGPAELRRLADVAAGELPYGFDALVNLLLRGKARPGDTGGLRGLGEALARTTGTPLSARCYLETGVGSAKAKGRSTLDNEDAAVAEITAGGDVRLAVFDGTTGDGDGSGRVAALSAVGSVTADWKRDTERPKTLLARAETAVREATDGCTTAVVATIHSRGDARIAAVGDSSAWLLRPGGQHGYVAWRLTPVHTRYAEDLREGTDPRGGMSDITRYLGGAAGSPFTADFTVCPGDLVLLATDGAATEERNSWFGDLLCRLACEYADDGRPLGAALAADLVWRAERAGGFDNATVLIADFTTV